MGDAEFATAMAPPSPPRNMADMALPANTVDSKFSFASNAIHPSGPSAGIAAAQGRKKVGNPNTSNNAVPTSVPSGNGGSGKHDKDKKGAAVPRLRFAGGSAATPSASIESDEEEYEYSIPLSEREAALTARDRDLIEQGDWSAIHDELSDNDFSLVGQRVADAHKSVMISSFQKGPAANQPVTIAPVGSGAVSGAINNPRGGRHFRSPQATADDSSSAAPTRPPPQHQFKNHSGGFQIEDSDEDSTHGSSGQAKNGKKGHNSPRKVVDRLDPIPLPLNEESAGILSGRRYENSNSKSNIGARKDPSGGAYAPIYPSLGSNAREKERVDKERDSKYGGGAKRGEEDWQSQNEERSRKEYGQVKSLAPAGGARYQRHNSKGQMEDDLDPVDGPSAADPPQLMVGEYSSVSAVRSKAGGVGRNGALGRLKAHGPPTGSSSSANINNENNSDFSLNVHGAGFGGAPAGPSNAVGPLDSVRPAKKNPSR